MPSVPGAGLLVYRRREESGGSASVPARPPEADGRRAHTAPIPVWELRPPADADAPAARAGLPFETRRNVKQRVVAERSLDRLLEHARRSFTALTKLEPPGPFLPLGGVKMRLHRVVYVWACEMSGAPADPAGSDVAFLPLSEARALIEPQQRRFLDQLEGLLSRPGV